jgi:hypothetical protein
LLSFGNWLVCRNINCGRIPATGFQDQLSAQAKLQTIQSDGAAMLVVRQLLRQEDPQVNLGALSDQEVITRLAKLLASRRFHLHAVSVRRQMHAPKIPGAAKTAAAFPLSQRSSSSGESAPAADPATFTSATDPAMQASTLRDASENGRAFVCECARA